MKKCSHDICGKEDMVWLPVIENNNNSVEKHQWCKRCGLVKNITDDRPHKIGYWMNLLSSISSFFHLTQCQKRLIAKEIEDSEYLDDNFGTLGTHQKILFYNIIRKYADINIDSIVY